MQYGQRKLQRSMTEMRRSWMGRRERVDAARGLVVSGMMFSRGSITLTS